MPAALFVQRPQLPELIQRALNIPGQGFGFARSDLEASVTALDLTVHQYRVLAGIRSFSAVRTVPAAAGAVSIATLRNPAGSGVIGTVSRIYISNFAFAQGILWTVLGPVIPALANQQVPLIGVRDSRILDPTGAPAPARLLPVWATSIGAPGSGQGIVVTPGQAYIISVEETIAPGGEFLVQSDTVNQSFFCGMDWEERQALRSELNLPGQL